MIIAIIWAGMVQFLTDQTLKNEYCKTIEYKAEYCSTLKSLQK